MFRTQGVSKSADVPGGRAESRAIGKLNNLPKLFTPCFMLPRHVARGGERTGKGAHRFIVTYIIFAGKPSTLFIILLFWKVSFCDFAKYLNIAVKIIRDEQQSD